MIDGEVNQLKSQFLDILDESTYVQLQQKNDRRISHKAMLAALMITVYHQKPRFQQAYQMLSLLMDMDCLIVNWRQNHIQLVQREIGKKPGTGRTGGIIYLIRTITEQYQLFIDLFNVASYLIPQQFLPDLTDELNESMDATITSSPSGILVRSYKDVSFTKQPHNNASSVVTYGLALVTPFIALYTVKKIIERCSSS